jgi:hypothetical protein
MSNPWRDIEEIEPFDDGEVPVPLARLQALLGDNRARLAIVNEMRKAGEGRAIARTRKVFDMIAALPEYLKPAPKKGERDEQTKRRG